jgi:hypothetical protein
MPGVTTQVKLPGLGGALKKNLGAPVEYGTEFVELPGGIVGGVARFVEGRFGVYKTGDLAGKPFCYLAGIVLSPKTAVRITRIWEPSSVPAEAAKGKGTIKVVKTEEVPTAGQRTSLMIPLCETKVKSGPNFGKVTSAEDNQGVMLTEIRKLNGETGDEAVSCLDGIENESGLEALFAELKAPGGDPKRAPLFKFGTQSQDPTPKYPEGGVWPHKWFGTKGLEDYVPPDEEANEIRDNTGSNRQKPPQPPKVAAPTPDMPDSNPDGAEDVAPDDETSSNDVATLLKQAKDEEHKECDSSRDRLLNIAIQNGYTEEQYVQADWEEVVKMVTSSADERGDEEQTPSVEPDAPPPPQLENVYSYRLLDPKSGKPLLDPKDKKKSRRPVQVIVTAVDEKKQTVDLRDLENNKIVYKKVPWDQLLPA